MNQLSQLKQFTTVVADTGNINMICKYKPYDATTNPSLILKIIHLPDYKKLIIDAIIYAKKKGGSKKNKIINASDKVLVNIGIEILKHIPGKVSSELDARLSFNKDACIEKAYKIITMYEEEGISRSRILIKLASTWECVQAAKELKKDNINCNLTLLFSLAQAKICADSEVFLISPFVGRIYDWYYEHQYIKTYNVDHDPGVLSLKKIYDYYKKYNYKTIIMGASFRNIQQIIALSGCDCLTISPNLLEELQQLNTNIIRNLIPSTQILEKPNILGEFDFRWQHNQDVMAVEKLSSGINQFSHDQQQLENILNTVI
ncbi:transaldolase [Buchnera aphidicola]|uniref:Transaldolase n=1 Tax=Buchnera aphidicola (Stegophylla sp.) TaxID=2315800 RepID=A0A4D6YAY4_9GAMM|nr:transaldolase [Buchnera aphidicola (Stegophylla sp.)]QCI26252.1 transaldolase [Buchnera aphidicola (Stegophylla sp.)]